jgi:hypothetical protein
MDSREYAFIFPVRTASDVPEDFRSVVDGRKFEHGIFIPQNDPGRFIESGPACIMLLGRSSLHVIPHPASGQTAVELSLNELAQMETGRSLLRGWIQFSTAHSTARLIYNTRASTDLDRFAAIVRRTWLGDPSAREPSQPKQFGPALDIKFGNLLADALDARESIEAQCFTPALEYWRGITPFKKQQRTPGHLIVVTGGSRLIWLKDECRGRYEPYAGVLVWTPLSQVTECRIEMGLQKIEFVIQFKAGNNWRIGIQKEASQWAAFSKLCQEAHSRLASTSPSQAHPRPRTTLKAR